MQQACQRQIDDLDKPPTGYHFDADRAERVCKFAGLMRHIKGKWAGKPIELEAWQIFILTTVFGWVDDEGNRRFKTAYIEVPRKNAKALALDTRVPTPEGWREIGEIVAGDVVFGADGKPCNVVRTSEIFTQNDCYQMTFSNGQVVVADAGHLWLTTARVNQPGKRAGREMSKKGGSVLEQVRTTKQIAESVRFGSRGDVNHSLKMPAPLELPEKNLPIDPYILGAWLGDGHSAGSRITCSIDDFENTKANILACGYGVLEPKKSANALTFGIYCFENGEKASIKSSKNFVSELRSLDLINNKHIPAEYLRGSRDQRLSLLQGLMDTDGTISKSGLVLSFTQKGGQIVGQVCEILASLGVKHSSIESPVSCNGKPCGTAFRVQFFANRDLLPAFRLERKLSRMLESSGAGSCRRSATVQIVSVDPVDPVPVKCLEVDSEDRLFLFGSSMLPTHNSTLSSVVALYCLSADGEAGAEIYSAATTRDQARIVWNDAKQMAIKSPGLRKKFGVETTAHTVHVTSTASLFKALSRDQGGNLDGLNTHCAIIDELHAHKTRDVFDVMETSTGAREQPLLWLITTAGFNRAGICYEQRAYVLKILSGIKDENYFGIVYTLDDGDSWEDPASWAKANPNWNVSVKPDDIERKARKAMQMSAATNNFLTKHLNVWVNADTAWMDMRAWERCADPTLDVTDFEGENCYGGLDLATKFDVASRVKLFERDGALYCFDTHYLPEDTVEQSGNSQYQGWEMDGYLTTTPGNVTDFDVIEEDIKADSELYVFNEHGFDPYQATQLSSHLLEHGLPMVQVGQTVKNLSEPMKELESLVMSGKFKHNGNPDLEWMISNVVAHVDAKDNIYPRKEFPENKIDGVVAILIAINRWMANDDSGHAYADRGFTEI